MFSIPPGNLIAFDTETTGKYWRFGDQPYCFGFCNENGDSSVISFPVDPFTRKVIYDKRIDIIRKWAEDSTIQKIAHNAQFDVGMLRGIGIETKGSIICTMNLIRILKSSVPLALKPFCKEQLGIPDDDETALKAETMKQRVIGKKNGWKVYQSKKSTEESSLAPDYWLAGPEYFEPYCQRDAERAMLVYKKLSFGIKELKLEKVWDTELKTWTVLRSIENRGIKVLDKKIISNKFKVKKKLQKFQTQVLNIVKKPINLRSPKQLKELFYDTFNEPIKFYSKGGHPSTDINALLSMSNPVAKLLLNIRSCEKTIDFMNQYLRFMVKGKSGEWFIHPNISQAIPSTGRESCMDPNLQQVASGESGKGEGILKVEARSVFAARDGYSLRSYDWKNIEVYIPTFKSLDKTLVKILLNNGDVHDHTAKSLTKLTGHPITRYYAKRTFFGLQYGIGVRKLAKDLGVETDMAENIIYGFKQSYPTLWNWMENLKLQARKNGFIITPYGRRIEVDQNAEYKGVNYYIQGTASSILKHAKIKVFNVLKKYNAHIVLAIHDELLIEVSKEENEKEIDEIVVRCMQDNPELNMPVNIPVSISKIGNNWAEKEKVS